jgi:DNA polymerase-4
MPADWGRRTDGYAVAATPMTSAHVWTAWVSLHKPDGLDVIDYTNVVQVYRQVGLLDLNGINTRYQARLNAAGIFTPLDFYAAPLPLLKQQVFRSINGY